MTTTYADHAIVQTSGNDFLQYRNASGAILYSINASGAVSTANGLAVSGFGQPGIVYTESASLGFAVFNTAAAVNMVAAAGPAGTYRFTLYAVTTTLFVTNTEETITLGFTDDDEAETVVWTTAALTAGTKLPPVSSTVSNSVTFRSTGTAAITWTPNVTGSAATAGAMAVSIVLERLI